MGEREERGGGGGKGGVGRTTVICVRVHLVADNNVDGNVAAT